MLAPCVPDSYFSLRIKSDLKQSIYSSNIVDLNLWCRPRHCVSSLVFTSLGFSGLFGPLLVCKKGSLDSDNRQKHYREFILHFVVTLEKFSWYYEFNKQQAKNTSTINEGMNFQFNSVH